MITNPATSLFVLSVMSLSGTFVHLSSGVLAKGIFQILALSIGVIFGAKLSKRIHGAWIIRALAIALGVVGVKIFMMAFTL